MRISVRTISNVASHSLHGLLFNPLNAELNTICHLLALLGAHRTFHVSRIRVKYHLPFSGIIRNSTYYPR